MSGEEFQFASELLSETNESMRDRVPRVEARVSAPAGGDGFCPDSVEIHPQKLLRKCKSDPRYGLDKKGGGFKAWLCPPNCYERNWTECPYRGRGK